MRCESFAYSYSLGRDSKQWSGLNSIRRVWCLALEVGMAFHNLSPSPVPCTRLFQIRGVMWVMGAVNMVIGPMSFFPVCERELEPKKLKWAKVVTTAFTGSLAFSRKKRYWFTYDMTILMSFTMKISNCHPLTVGRRPCDTQASAREHLIQCQGRRQSPNPYKTGV